MWLDLNKFDLPKWHHTSHKSNVKVNRSSFVGEENKKCWTLYRKTDMNTDRQNVNEKAE